MFKGIISGSRPAWATGKAHTQKNILRKKTYFKQTNKPNRPKGKRPLQGFV